MTPEQTDRLLAVLERIAAVLERDGIRQNCQAQNMAPAMQTVIPVLFPLSERYGFDR